MASLKIDFKTVFNSCEMGSTLGTFRKKSPRKPEQRVDCHFITPYIKMKRTLCEYSLHKRGMIILLLHLRYILHINISDIKFTFCT